MGNHMKYVMKNKLRNRHCTVGLFVLMIFFTKNGYVQSDPAAAVKKIIIREGEKWFGGAVNEAHHMPFPEGYRLNLYADNRGNQTAPLLLSSKGRFVWSEQPFQFEIKNNRLIISKAIGKIIIDSSGHSLADAFKSASKLFFPASGKFPDSLLFLRPQYNTWIELVYDQNQEDILRYAHSIIDNGFPP